MILQKKAFIDIDGVLAYSINDTVYNKLSKSHNMGGWSSNTYIKPFEHNDYIFEQVMNHLGLYPILLTKIPRYIDHVYHTSFKSFRNEWVYKNIVPIYKKYGGNDNLQIIYVENSGDKQEYVPGLLIDNTIDIVDDWELTGNPAIHFDNNYGNLSSLKDKFKDLMVSNRLNNFLK